MEKIGAFAYARKIIECGMQDEKEVEKVLEFNKQNNYEYEITTDDFGSGGSLINSKCFMKFIYNGYVLQDFGDKIWLRHKNYLAEQEKKRQEEKEKKDNK